MTGGRLQWWLGKALARAPSIYDTVILSAAAALFESRFFRSLVTPSWWTGFAGSQCKGIVVRPLQGRYGRSILSGDDWRKLVQHDASFSSAVGMKLDYSPVFSQLLNTLLVSSYSDVIQYVSRPTWLSYKCLAIFKQFLSSTGVWRRFYYWVYVLTLEVTTGDCNRTRQGRVQKTTTSPSCLSGGIPKLSHIVPLRQSVN